MKKFVIFIVVLCTAMSILTGCSSDPQKTFVNANNEIDVFTWFNSVGGEITEIKLELSGRGEFTVKFPTKTNFEHIERQINVSTNAVSEHRYAEGDIVIFAKKISDTQAIFCVPNVNSLSCDKIRTLKYEDYKKEVMSGDFVDEHKKPVATALLDLSNTVFILDDIPNINITIGGKFVAVTSFGLVKLSGSVVSYAGSECVLICTSNNLFVILAIVLGIVVLLVIVILLLAKYGVFTDLKLRLAKKSKK